METPSKDKKDPTKTFDEIVDSMNKFMTGVSGYEGIETEIDSGRTYKLCNSYNLKKMKNWAVITKILENWMKRWKD